MFYIDVIKVDRDVHMLQWLYMYVLSVCSKCFIYFRRMLQVFYLEVAKLDRDVAYMQVFSYICCKCFILMFSYVCNGYTHVFKFFFGCFASVSDVCL